MDWMQFVSALVSALAWPCSVVVVVCLLKNPILGLIPKIPALHQNLPALPHVTNSLQHHVDDLPQLPIMHPNTPAKPRLTQSASSNRAGFFCLEKTT